MRVDDLDQRILSLLQREGALSSSRLANELSISRQAVHRRLTQLVHEGALEREGAARATRYRLVEQCWDRRFALLGLEEDRVFAALAEEVPAIASLDGDATQTVGYVVTELVNNAIDHSSGTKVDVRVRVMGDRLELTIEDDGVGAFAHVRDSLGLEDELAAIQQISKGKTTTDSERHTGEGLFFCSKAAEVFRLESGKFAWIVDNERGEFAIAELDAPREGTLATAEVDLTNVRELRALFDAYTDDFEFSKTRVVIKLFEYGVRFISRSEAKRLLLGLERFRQVVLDFAGVEAVGQGFADEVFRVWASTHPETALLPVNMNEAVEFMVERARSAL